MNYLLHVKGTICFVLFWLILPRIGNNFNYWRIVIKCYSPLNAFMTETATSLLNTVNDLINAHSRINAPYLINAPLEV